MIFSGSSLLGDSGDSIGRLLRNAADVARIEWFGGGVGKADLGLQHGSCIISLKPSSSLGIIQHIRILRWYILGSRWRRSRTRNELRICLSVLR